MAKQQVSIQVGGNRKTTSWKDYCKDGKDWKCFTLDGSKDFSDQLDAAEDNRNFKTKNSVKGALKDLWKGLGDDKKDKNKNKNKDKDNDKGTITKANEPPPYVGTNNAGQGLTQAEWDLYQNTTLTSLQGQIGQQLQDSINATSLGIQNLQNEAAAYGWDTQQAMNIYSQDAASWRTDISTQREKDWRMYDSAMGYKATTDSAKIQGEYGLALGKIMQAGNAEVAKINGEYSNANTRLSGEYNIAGEKIRGAAARDVAQRNKEATMFGSFLGGFWS